MARLFQCRVAKTGVAQGDNRQPAFRIFAKEWRSLQRERCRYGILRSGAAARWRPGAAGDHDGRRSAVSSAVVCCDFAIQEGGRRFEMGSHAVYRKMRSSIATKLASVLLC